MTESQVREAAGSIVLAIGDRARTGYRIDPVTTFAEAGRLELLQHLLFMCEEIPRLLDAGKREKAMRWLGFAQGLAWALGIVPTIAELKDANR